MSPTLTDTKGADLISAVAAMSKEERRARLDRALRSIAAAEGEVLALVGEVDRNQDYRDDGATSTEAWLAERYGVSASRARSYVHVGEKVFDTPHLLGALSGGDISFDKVRVLADVATPETDRQLCSDAHEHSVRELADIARAAGELQRASSPDQGRTEHERRYVRFNDEHRTISAQLPPESYVEAKTRLHALLEEIPSEGDTPLDQRRADAFMELIRSSGGDTTKKGKGSRFFVVAHVPLAALVDDSGTTTGLAGELEGHGLIDCETVRRIACDATFAVAVDDDVGHTMYEGRAKRFATQAQRREVMRRDRHCRFPGCTNVTFTNVHHVVPWKLNGRTDLDNLALTCLHHHHLVHSNQGWTVSGNANEELTFTGPTGRVMTSRPSALWTRVTGGR
jgi:hypothetical protein